MRVYRVTQSKVLAFGCGFLVAGRLCLNLSLMADVTRDGRLAVTKIPSFKWQAVAEMSSGAVSDICIATCMCIGLLQRRSGFAPTTKLVDRLVAFTIGITFYILSLSFTHCRRHGLADEHLLHDRVAHGEYKFESVIYNTDVSGSTSRCLQTVCTRALTAARCSTFHVSVVWIACFGVVSKLFSNSLLASLNQRRFHQTGTFRTAQTSGGASTHIEFHRVLTNSVRRVFGC